MRATAASFIGTEFFFQPTFKTSSRTQLSRSACTCAFPNLPSLINLPLVLNESIVFVLQYMFGVLRDVVPRMKFVRHLHEPQELLTFYEQEVLAMFKQVRFLCMPTVKTY